MKRITRSLWLPFLRYQGDIDNIIAYTSEEKAVARCCSGAAVAGASDQGNI
jgi:hypothetical protein